MARTLAAINSQIKKLQREAENLRRDEVKDVVSRIRDAIAHYALTPDDLFARSGRGRPKGSRNHAKVPQAPPAKRGRKLGAVAVKYRDADGNTWTGRGSKPRWLAAALAAGKSVEDFSVK